MGVIKAVCISERKGTAKDDVREIELIENHGLAGDSHAGDWHRQVSLLSYDKVRAFEKLADFSLESGAFGENLLVEGIDLSALPIGTRLVIGEVVLEVTQIGKECHHGCEIRRQVGDCIMPREGIFARVLVGGRIQVGDGIESISPNGFRAAVLTISDKGAKGEREDLSGALIRRVLKAAGYEISHTAILPDEREEIAAALTKLSDEQTADLILTTGGTGFSPRDVTPEATLDVVERLVPGIPEAMRSASLAVTKRAMLTRAQAGLRKQTLIINLPGSPKAVRENMEVFMESLTHGLEILTGRGGECGQR